MAKRRDQLIAAAKDRAAGAKILTLKALKDFTVTLGDIRQVREDGTKDKPGRVIKQVQLLTCHCRVAGMLEPISAEIEMEAGENWGVTGELEQCLAPALRTFIDQVKAAHITTIKEQQKPLPEAIQHFANPDGTMAKPPNPGRVAYARRTQAMLHSNNATERLEALNRARKLKRMEEKDLEAPAEPAPAASETAEGGAA